ncbi:hypothetical protein SDC9_204341 [bioreactor metagenome]|uniref:Uncharacterized protein n=1 Tax=bioreactor metagenome TaxID=1076179 RepID=A0A645IZ94_9ZZZZ
MMKISKGIAHGVHRRGGRARDHHAAQGGGQHQTVPLGGRQRSGRQRVEAGGNAPDALLCQHVADFPGQVGQHALHTVGQGINGGVHRHPVGQAGGIASVQIGKPGEQNGVCDRGLCFGGIVCKDGILRGLAAGAGGGGDADQRQGFGLILP